MLSSETTRNTSFSRRPSAVINVKQNCSFKAPPAMRASSVMVLSLCPLAQSRFLNLRSTVAFVSG